MMRKAVLGELLAGVRRAAPVTPAGRALRAAQVNAAIVRRLRASTNLSQAAFALLLGVELGTLRNWEQGRREPTGPARALLRAIRNDPENVIRALGRSGARAVRRGAPREAA